MGKIKELINNVTGEVTERIRGSRRLSLEEYHAKLIARGLDPATGHYVPDRVPMAPPIGYKRHPTVSEMIRDQVRSEHLRQALIAAGDETFEEADNFDIPDDHDRESPYEVHFDPPVDQGPAPTPAPRPSPTAPEAPPTPPSQAAVPEPPKAQ